MRPRFKPEPNGSSGFINVPHPTVTSNSEYPLPVRVHGVFINLNKANVSGVDAEIAYRAGVD